MQHVELSGTVFEMGLQHGRRLAGLIAQVIERTCQFPEKTLPAVRGASRDIEKTLSARHPNLVEEMRGIAEGADLPYEDILLLNVAYDAQGAVPDPPLRCTAIGLPDTAEGPLVAKTDDVAIEERDFEVFFRVQPRDGHAFIYYAFGGTVWNHGGINDSGLALAMTGLGPAGERDPRGIPSLLFLRQVLLRCATVEEALAFARANPLRSSGCTMTMAEPTSGDITVVEKYPAVQTVHRSSREPTVHTNHPQYEETLALPHDELWASRLGIPDLMPNSLARQENAARLVKKIPWTIEGLQQLLGNHAQSGAVCQHGRAGLHTSIAMIMVPQQRAMIAAEGYGCGPYVEYRV